jgi:hypothetical protein
MAQHCFDEAPDDLARYPAAVSRNTLADYAACGIRFTASSRSDGSPFASKWESDRV